MALDMTGEVCINQIMCIYYSQCLNTYFVLQTLQGRTIRVNVAEPRKCVYLNTDRDGLANTDKI